MTKVWFITGSSRGLGRSLVEAVLAKGDSVVATARDPKQLKQLEENCPEQVYLLTLDVTNKEQVVNAVEQAAKFGLGGFSEALSKEVAPLGIRVTSVEPGGFRTGWSGASMTYAPEVEGYESTVAVRTSMFQGGEYVPMGDPGKAAKVMIDLVENPDPPVPLILGSEAVSILRTADAARKAEFEKWVPVSVSTDHDEAANFLETKEGKAHAKL